MAAKYDTDLVLTPPDIQVDLKLLIEDIFSAFLSVIEFSIKFKEPIEKLKGRISCEISSKELFECLETKSIPLETYTLVLTYHFNWRILFIHYLTTDCFPLLRKLEVSCLHFLDPDQDRALSCILNLQKLESLFIRRSNLGRFKDILQFWNLTELKVLDLQSNALTILPASIGMLSKLEILNLNSNSISEKKFPFTVLNCEHLSQLHFKDNLMNYLPFIIQKLNNLEFITNTTSKYIDTVNQNLQGGIISLEKVRQRKLFTPLPLQILSCEIILGQNPLCWKDRSLAPLLCRVLDRAIERCELCFVCNNVYTDAFGGFYLTSVLPSFLGASITAFRQWCCSDKCSEIAKVQQKELNASISLARDLEESEITSYYEEELKTLRDTQVQVNRTNPRRKDKCIIS